MTNDDEISSNASNSYNTGSISLIDLQEYNQLYNELKIKYGEHMTKVCDEILPVWLMCVICVS